MSKAIMRRLFVMMLIGVSLGVHAADVPKASSHLLIQGDTVYDKKSNLTWARCSVGQQWEDGVGCKGLVGIFTFDEAQKQAGGGWRVPTKSELGTLIVAGKQKPTIDEVAFPNMDLEILLYWTSTPDGNLGGWHVHFEDGSIDGNGRSSANAVRLVRDGMMQK